MPPDRRLVVQLPDDVEPGDVRLLVIQGRRAREEVRRRRAVVAAAASSDELARGLPAASRGHVR